MMGEWTFFSNYGHVLVCLARNSNARLRDVAADVGVTERAVQKIVKDLQSEGFITVRKQGRCNRYRINRRKTLRHDLEGHITVGKLLALTAAGRHVTAYVVEDELPAGESIEAGPASVDPQATVESPVPEPEPVAASEFETVAMPEPEAVPEPPPKPDSKRKSKPKAAPQDVEQQGSLF